MDVAPLNTIDIHYDVAQQLSAFVVCSYWKATAGQGNEDGCFGVYHHDVGEATHSCLHRGVVYCSSSVPSRGNSRRQWQTVVAYENVVAQPWRKVPTVGQSLVGRQK
jgi:hypothetical protein